MGMPNPREVPLDMRPTSYWDPVRVKDIPVRGQAPGFGGGTYLPALLKGEVEVAAFCLDSTTGDVISIRARPVSSGVRYRVVDEYGTRIRIHDPVRSGSLSLGELVALIDSQRYQGHVGLLEGILATEWEASEGKRPSHMRRFVTVVSAYYRDLPRLYRERAHAWVQRVLVDRDHQRWAEWTGVRR